jgi:hypothetical protein
MQYLGRHDPELIDAYAKLYQNGSYITRSYATDLARQSSVLLRNTVLIESRTCCEFPIRAPQPCRRTSPSASRASSENRLVSVDLGRRSEHH